jgi:hypothetical protein
MGMSQKNVQYMPSNEAAKVMAVAVVAIIVVGFTIGILPKITETGKQFSVVINPPNAIVTSKNCRTGMKGLDYIAWIDVSIHNDGGAGTVVVWVQVTQGSRRWTKSQSLYLGSQASRDLTLAFNEIGFWTTNSIYYIVWVE